MARPILTLDQLNKRLSYNPEDGLFTCLVANKRMQIGDKVGSPCQGYLRTKIEGRHYLLHRLAWLWMTGRWPKETIDQINGNRSDNRFANLRDIPKSAQNQNRRTNSNNKSGLSGVCLDKTYKHPSYRATIYINCRSYHLGLFPTQEEAHAAYIAAKRKLHPFNTL